MARRFFYNLLAVLLLASITRAQFNFPNFVASDSLILARDATIVGDTLRLTSATRGQGGASWYRYQEPVNDSFQTIFRFQITQRGGLGGGADGFAFVIQNSGDSVIGLDGGNIGYGGILNSLAIEFDTYDNGSIDPNNNHISIQSRGVLANSPSQTYSLGWSSTVPSFIDGSVHIAKITYASDTFRVYLDDLTTAAITSRVNLDSLLSLNAAYAWVGFTAATGNGYENHFILDWSFDTAIDTSYAGIIPTVFWPGIMESPLYDNGDDLSRLTHFERVWVAFLNTLSSDEFLNALALDETGTRPLIAGVNIISAPLVGDAARTIRDELNWHPLKYIRSFVNYLETNGFTLDNYDGTHTADENLYFGTYDWRLSLDALADSLSYYIDSVLKWTGAPKVNIVTHSMGGLVAKDYIRLFGPGRIHKLIFVGTPHLGAPKIEYTMFTGDIVLPDLVDIFIDEARLKAVSRNMPSSYSLLPSEDYFDISLSNGVSSGYTLYQRCLTLNRGLSFNELGYLATSDFLQSTPGWPGPKAEFNNDLIESAYNMHADLNNINFGSIEVYNIVGTGLKTISEVNFTGDAKLKNRANATSLFTGDGTVPLRSAEVVNHSLTRANYYVHNAEHSRIFENEGVQQLVRLILEDPPDTAGFSHASITTNPPASYLVNGWLMAIASPVELHAYDSFGNHTGSTGDSTWESNIPSSYYQGGKLSNPHSAKKISLPPGGEYELIVKSLDTTASFRFQVEQSENGIITQYAIFDSVSTTPNFQAKMHTSNSAGAPKFEVDYDGDSVYGATVWPDQIQITQAVKVGWNLLSLPLAESTSAFDVYTNTASNPFIYQGGYTAVDSLTHGPGFWMKFTADQSFTLFGKGNFLNSIPVQSGWNIVGGLSTPIPVDSVTTDPEGIIGTNFYYFDDGYFTADTLKPGRGYWVKTNQAGSIILRAN